MKRRTLCRQRAGSWSRQTRVNPIRGVASDFEIDWLHSVNEHSELKVSRYGLICSGVSVSSTKSKIDSKVCFVFNKTSIRVICE